MNIRVDHYVHMLPADPGIQDSLTKLEKLAMTNQQKLDAVGAAVESVSTALTSAATGIRADIQALKDANAAGEALDFTAVDQKVTNLQAAAKVLEDLDAENPPATPPVVPTV